MFDLDKISKDVEIVIQKYGSVRKAAKETNINKTSLEDCSAKVTDPRVKNIEKLAKAAGRKSVAYYYKFPADNKNTQNVDDSGESLTLQSI